MTLPRPGMQRPLVLVAAGPAAAVIALQQQAGPPLASALGLPWCEPLADRAPQQALAPLAQQGPGLVPLPLDPGLPLPGAGHWAEALGAWRQPVLLLLAGDQLDSGLPAAMAALLHQWQVPLGWCSGAAAGIRMPAVATACPGWAGSLQTALSWGRWPGPWSSAGVRSPTPDSASWPLAGPARGARGRCWRSGAGARWRWRGPGARR